MKNKIVKLSENQVKYIKSRLSEMDVMANLDSSTDPNTAFKNVGRDLQKQGIDPNSKDVNIIATGDNASSNGYLEEMSFTKRQLKEARFRKMMKEGKVFTKKSFDKKYNI